MTPDHVRQIAGQAKVELDLTERAFEAMRLEALNNLLNSAPGDADIREEAYRRIKAIDYVRQALQQALTSAWLENEAENRSL